jgi:hypothetical protein
MADLKNNKVQQLLRTRSFWIATGTVGLLLHLLAARPLFEFYDRLLAWFLLIIFLSTTYSYLKGPIGKVPLLPLVTFQLYLMYGVAQFTQEGLLSFEGWYTPPGPAISRSMGIVFLGECGMLLMFKVGDMLSRVKEFSWVSVYPEVQPGWQRGVMLFGVFGVVMYFVQCTQIEIIPIGIRNIVQMVINPYLALVVVFYFSEYYQLKRFKLLAIIMVITMALAGLLSGMIEAVVAPVYIFVLATWIWGGHLRVKLTICALIVVVVLSPIKHSYRVLKINLPPVQSLDDFSDRFGLWGEAINKTMDDPTSEEILIQTAASRTSAIINLAQVVDWVPTRIPYNRGDGLITAVIYWVPRILWPNKPGFSSLINNRYAIEFGLSDEEGLERSSFGIVQPADGYWDFGVLGAIGYTSLLGLIYGFLYGSASDRSPTPTIIVIVFSVFSLQALAGLQNIIASSFSLFIGAWFALTGIKIMSMGIPVRLKQV